MIQRYDADEDEALTFWEFANILLPSDVEQKNLVLERDEKNESVSTYGEELVRRFVSSIVNLEHIHKLRRESAIKGFDPKQLFQ